jgi:hypothetical protein
MKTILRLRVGVATVAILWTMASASAQSAKERPRQPKISAKEKAETEARKMTAELRQKTRLIEEALLAQRYHVEPVRAFSYPLPATA